MGSDWRVESENIARHTFNSITLSHSSSLPQRSKALLSAIPPIIKALDILRSPLALDLDAAKKTHMSISRMCGLATLPEDIIQKILFHAVINSSGAVEIQSSVQLSHVSRRFRKLALSTGDLWTDIRLSASSKSLVEACISRSGDCLVDVSCSIDISLRTSIQRALELIPLVIPIGNRWRTINLEFDSGPSHLGRDETPDITDVFSVLEDLILPNLRGVEISNRLLLSLPVTFDGLHSPQIMSLFTKPFFGAHWVTPRLEALNLQNYIPHGASHPFLNLASMTLHLTPFAWPCEHVVEWLAACSSLTNLKLVLDRPHFKFGDAGSEATPTALPSIRKLELRFLYENNVDSLNILKAVVFPGCLDLGIFIATGEDNSVVRHELQYEDDNWDTLELYNYAVTIFGDSQLFPSVESLQLDFNIGQLGDFTGLSFDLLLENITSLKNLTLSSNLTLHLYIDTHINDAWVRYPALRTVTLNCDYKPLKEWLMSLAEKLEIQGDWEGFEHLTVRVKDRVTKKWNDVTIPKTTMRSWSNVSFSTQLLSI
ncbi:hypothetical protein SCHPADRAFT_348362 [Schizopora paradoxa]|uniref:Uncharacterized protein n=1 Tax=Schizopora paradoxa TaxID=27342 RepID=A0A0H2S9Y4_9AGAM|nr:hypothetical protein SCHPADRAFT_348362 [Schizopora paradoxa]